MLNRDHWLSIVQPLGKERVEIAYQRSFTAAEVDKLRAGLWPQSMDDRWVVFLGPTSLDLWRSWTGHCIYSLPIQVAGDGIVVGPLTVNDNHQQYQRPDEVGDIRNFESVISMILNN